MQTESMHNDIGMPLEQGRPRGHGGGRETGPWTYRKKVCRVCGTEFDPATGRQATCSEECRKAASAAKVKRYYEKTHPITERACLNCGNPFYTREVRAKYCSAECREVMAKTYQQRYRKERTQNKKCGNCGKEFSIPYGNDRKYCSKSCRLEAFKAKQAANAKPRKCKTCGVLFKASKAWTSHSFCSDACRPKQPTECAWCNGPMPEQRGLLVDKYCCSDCKRRALAARARAKAKEKAEEKEKQRRRELCAALLLWRKGASIQTIEERLEWKEGTGSGKMLRSAGYRQSTEKRKNGSVWHEVEAGFNARSQQFRLERDFRDHAVNVLSGFFEYVRPEVSIPGTRRKIDIVVKHGLHSFGIELKNGNRTARLDQTLGQALVKCAALNLLIPVCAVPDDIRMDKVFLNGCKATKVIAGTISQVAHEMLQVVAGHPLRYSAKI